MKMMIFFFIIAVVSYFTLKSQFMNFLSDENEVFETEKKKKIDEVIVICQKKLILTMIVANKI